MHDFTWLEGLDIQTKDLNRWKVLLNKEAFDLLVEYTAKETARLQEGLKRQSIPAKRAGYEVPRGTTIDDYVHNHVYRVLTRQDAIVRKKG